MSRVPVKVRFVVAFAAVTGVFLVVAGLFVYQRLDSELESSAERELSARLAGLVTIVRDDGDDLGDPVQDPLDTATDEGFVQVLDSSGDVAGGNRPELEQDPILSPAEVDSLTQGELNAIEREVPEVGETLRLKAAPATDDGARYTAIAGTSLAGPDQALSDLLLVLLIGGPLALVLAGLIAYALAGAALRPIAELRASAETVEVDEPRARLPVSPARDEIAALGGALNGMLDRVREALRGERSFAADAADELRAPVTSLRTDLDLALREEGSDVSRGAVQAAVERTDDLMQVADDLRVIAHAAAGSLALRRAQVDLEELVAVVASRFEQRAEDMGRSIALAVPSDMSIEVDRSRLERALGEMVENAVAHGGGLITVGAVTKTGGVELHVTDQGPGFPNRSARDGFSRLSRGSHGRSRGATGIGLAVVDAIAQGHGGSAHAASRSGGGADVWIWLPSRPPSEDGRPTDDIERRAASS